MRNPPNAQLPASSCSREIFEQPRTVRECARGHLIRSSDRAVRRLEHGTRRVALHERIIIAAIGTSWHAALVGEYLIEELAHIPVEVEYAHEFCYRNAPIQRETVLLVISHQGKPPTPPPRCAKPSAAAIGRWRFVNVVGSTIARESDGGIYMMPGAEIGVASTKAFISDIRSSRCWESTRPIAIALRATGHTNHGARSRAVPNR